MKTGLIQVRNMIVLKSRYSSFQVLPRVVFENDFSSTESYVSPLITRIEVCGYSGKEISYGVLKGRSLRNMYL
jgi:hypothetical protein